MAMLKSSLVMLAAVATALAAPQGNQYLPPAASGYNYPKPDVPFSPSTRPPTTLRPPPERDGGTLLPGFVSTQAPHGGGGDHHHHEPGMPFDFNYAVKDDQYGTDYSHNAISDGDVVRGEYRVQLPDGRLQIVRYTADWATGFHADVQYEGEARYPDGPAPGAAPGGYPRGPSKGY